MNNKERFIEFWIAVFVKIIRTFTSVKVLGLIFFTYLTTWLLLNKYIDDNSWTIAVTTVVTVIYGVREVYKLENIKSILYSKILKDNNGENNEIPNNTEESEISK